jgi:hypothetical protein
MNRMTKMLGSSLLMLIVGSLANAAEPSIMADRVVVKNRPLIAGLWAMPIPNKSCIEYYNFLEDGRFLIQSHHEWTTGTYEYVLPALGDSTLPLLTMTIRYDNNEMDCSGNKVDQSNEVQRQFIRWNPQQRQMEFCGTPEGAECLLALRRVLP